MILITGATGLVGSHLAFELAKKGEKIRALYRNESKLNRVKEVFSYYTSSENTLKYFEAIEWMQADINDIPALEKAFKGIEKVYHCAALISFNPADAKELRATNITGTANIVNFCIAHKVKKLCHVSSVASLGKELSKSEITEESIWNPESNHSDYAISKYGAEIEVWRGSQEGVAVIIVNPGIIIGPGFWEAGSGPIFKRIQRGLNYYVTKKTGFVGVKDVVSSIQLLMNSEIKNEKYILVAENISFRRVLNEIAKNLEKPIPRKELKKWMLWFGWFYTKLSSFFGAKREISTSTIKNLFEDSFFSNKKIKNELGFEFTQMEEVITETAGIYRKETTESR